MTAGKLGNADLHVDMSNDDNSNPRRQGVPLDECDSAKLRRVLANATASWLAAEIRVNTVTLLRAAAGLPLYNPPRERIVAYLTPGEPE